MATRRPKVPRATPAAPQSPGTGDGGAVIRGDFGARAGGTGTVPGTEAAAAEPASGRPALHRPAAEGPLEGTATVRRGGGAGTTTGATTGATGTARHPAAAGAAAAAPKRKAPVKHNPVRPAPSLDPVPAKAFSGRMLALTVVMVAITVMLAPTVKIFVDKRAEIAALEADIAVKQEQQTDLKRQVSRWKDPNYVKQQARDRINMVMPGETGYWVFGGDLPAGASGGTAGEGPAQSPADLPWVDALWESIRRSATD